MERRSSIPWYYRIAGIAVASALSVLFLVSSWGEALSLIGYDFAVGVRGVQKVSEDIVIVAIDESSFDELDLAWPWPRSTHAKLLDSLFAESVKSVAFDLLFAETSTEQEDRALAAAIDRYKRVALAVDYELVTDSQFGYDLEKITEPLPILDLLEGEVELGLIKSDIDPDGFIRRGRYRQHGINSLAVAAVQAATPEREYVFDETARLIRFLGPPRTFPTISYYQALDPKDTLPAGFLRDKIVFVGFGSLANVASERAALDHFPVPFTRTGSGLMAGVEIHANTAQMLIDGEENFWVSMELRACLAFFVGLLSGIIFLSLSPISGGVFLFAYTVLAVVTNQSMFINYDLYLPPLNIILPIATNYVPALVLHYWEESKKRRFVRETFGRYLAPKLVNRLLENEEEVALGGEEVEATVLFLDISGFTSFSEDLKASELIDLVNRCLGTFAEIILEEEGMIDKYIGDAIMAIWGVPLVQEKHAEMAVRAALAILDAEQLVRQAEKESSGVEISIRIGINSGQMVAGNVGGGQRFNYTVLGNEVNLAARLEGVNKFYGTSLLVSESTASVLGEDFILREIDTIKVKGKEHPVTVFEVRSERARYTEQEKQLDEVYAAGLASYRKQDWGAAVEYFEKALAVDSADGPSNVMFERCKENADKDVPPDWQPVFEFTVKL